MDPLVPPKLAWKIMTRSEGLLSRILCAKYFSERASVDRTVHIQEEVQIVLSIPLSRMDMPDCLVWHYTREGEFLVRSAYQLDPQQMQQLLPSTSSRTIVGRDGKEGGQWSYIWKSCTPSKVQNFIWRVCHEVLHTVCNLGRRNVEVDVCCSLCQSAEESLAHVLFHCSFARQVWALSYIPWRLLDPMEDSVQRSIEQV
ncbi:UNVERIFIED_CONTAM: hypothetical protein Slati_3938900 [Sesamum latifolium]|uniref:Reverse transcriptase zinc-binding domain-containing protein n=1 Tax=Sesamum latifolium TaxID=2727402 RepID=A0AAW2TN06_9LAMI